MTSEIVWLSHDNTIDLLLEAKDVAQDLSSVTKITATFDNITITSVDHAAGAILWNNGGYDTGEIRLDLGGEAIPAGGYDVPIVVYDPSNPNGVVWGPIHMAVKAEVEAS